MEEDPTNNEQIDDDYESNVVDFKLTNRRLLKLVARGHLRAQPVVSGADILPFERRRKTEKSHIDDSASEQKVSELPDNPERDSIFADLRKPEQESSE